MTKKKYYLITSSDEQLWKFDRPVVFLGEWCRLKLRKHIWQSMEAIVADPYGIGLIEKNSNNSKVKKIQQKLFNNFYEILNKHHKTNYGKRFWQIIVGHWFDLYVHLIFKKVNTLKHCINSYDISGTTCYVTDNYNLATKDYGDSISALDDLRWNNFLNTRILDLLGKVNFPIEFIKEEDKPNSYPGFKLNKSDYKYSFKEKVFKFCHQVYSLIANRLVRVDDAFIINSYLPFKEEIKLELALRQFPQRWKRLKSKIYLDPDKLLRKKLTNKFVNKTENEIEKILSILLFELLPISYLEGFADQQKITEQLPWPKSPKFIFTSNNFHTDEIFKLWSALKIEKGSKYYVGQHGNNYYTQKYLSPTIEEKTADKFITWGWENGLPNFKPGFVFSLAGKKKEEYNKQGGLLLIESSFNIKNYTCDTYYEYMKYFEDQKEFVNKLDNLPKNKLTVRLYPGFKNKNFHEDFKWLEFDQTIKINTEVINISHLIKENRLIVHSYDSTGMLETLSQNIPTLAFWQNNFDHIVDKVKPDYQLLVDAGIVHFSAQSVASKVNEIWEDVDVWWQKSHVQNARKKFCDKFAKSCSHPTKTIISLLTK